jgi:transcription antitermination factor NusG
MDRQHRNAVLETPGVIYVVGSERQSDISDQEICLLREASTKTAFEPYRELVVGERVRIKNGALRGVEGVLVRKQDSLRFVLTVNMINQCAALEVNAEDIEAITQPIQLLQQSWHKR